MGLRTSRTATKDAWAALFDDGLDEVFGYLVHRCGDAALAQDLTSETFLAAARSAHTHPELQPTVGWLVTIARNKLIDHWRHAAVEERTMRVIASQESEREANEWSGPVDEGPAMAVLHSMSPQNRAVLTLRYVDGLSVAETAQVLDRTVQATETLLARAKAQFRTRYAMMKDGDRDDA